MAGDRTHDPSQDGTWRLGGRVRRAATPARLLAKGMVAATVAQARALRGDRMDEILADPKLAEAAESIARELGLMKGAAMKIGQALSVVDVSLIPAEYRTALTVLQSEAPPMPYEAAAGVVEDELGAPPDELFDFFSPLPIAAASIGQVHMARIGDEELVVKVQYPGIAKAVEADLQNAALLSTVARLAQRMLAGLAGDIDVRSIIEEVRDRVTDELDYGIEARNQAEFADLFAGSSWAIVPRVRPDLSSRRVLTSEYVDGMRWSAALQASQDLRDAWGAAIFDFFAASLFGHGVCNVDTHPGNYLFLEDGRIAFVDFGCVSRIDEDQRLRVRKLAAALISGDPDAVLDTLVEAGILRRRDGFAPGALMEPLGHLLPGPRAPQPFTYSRAMLEDLLQQLLRLRVGVDEVRILQRLEMPREYVLLGRMTLGVEALLAHLECTIDFRRPYAEHLDGVIDARPAWAVRD